MHNALPTSILLSTLLFHTATAFYPYQPDDSTPSARSRRIHALDSPRTDDNARSLTLLLHRIATRQNAYNILNSVDPKQANSVAIDQDGGDLSYMVAVTFGDSKEEYHLLLDSAASNTWVMGQDCASAACGTHTTFGKGDSSSLTTETTPFNITYGTGSVSGTLASDTLHIGSLTPTLKFGLATNVSQEFRSYPMDGILGIGRGTPSSQISVMDALSTSNLLGAKLYGIHLSRATGGFADGELNLGAVNEDRFTGAINFMDIVENDTGFWEISLQGASVGDEAIALPGAPRTAIIDTGTSYILVPSADASALHAGIQGSKAEGEIFYVPCDTRSTLSFTFNNVGYNISTSDWRGGRVDSEGGLCRSNIIGRQTFGAGQWLVGDVFLKNVYAVFDFEKGRVGFGTRNEEEGAVSSTATAGSGTPTVLGVPSPTGSSSSGGSGGGVSTTAVAGGESQAQSGATTLSASFCIVLASFGALSLFI